MTDPATSTSPEVKALDEQYREDHLPDILTQQFIPPEPSAVITEQTVEVDPNKTGGVDIPFTQEDVEKYALPLEGLKCCAELEWHKGDDSKTNQDWMNLANAVQKRARRRQRNLQNQSMDIMCREFSLSALRFREKLRRATNGCIKVPHY